MFAQNVRSLHLKLNLILLLKQKDASDSACEGAAKVVSSIMRKIDYNSGRNLLQGAADRPLVMIQRAGRKGSRAAVRRLPCP